MNNLGIVFYEGTLNYEEVSNILKLKVRKYLFINIRDFKEQESIIHKFFENELSSIKFFNQNSNIFKLIKKLVTIFNIFNNSNRFDTPYQHFSHLKNIKFKEITNYLTPDIYENASKFTIKLFNVLKNKPFIKNTFQINNTNLYEINRLEFVTYYFDFFLNFLTVYNLIELEEPNKIYILSSVKLEKAYYIKLAAKRENIEIKVFAQKSSSKEFRHFLKSKFRILIDYFWYWNIWNLLNKKSIDLNNFKTSKKKNLVFCQYKNFFPSLIQVLIQLQNTKNLLNILYVPHKLLKYSKEVVQREDLRNVKILPFYDVNYSSFRKRFNSFKKMLIDVKYTSCFDDIEFKSIRVFDLIKISFFKLHEKLSNSLRYLENFHFILDKIKPNIITVLSGNDPIDVLITRIAKENNIKTIFIPHALGGNSYEYQPLEQDYVVCAGNKEKDYYLSLGTTQNKLLTLGIPLFDKLFNKFSKIHDVKIIHKELVERYNLNTTKKIILLVTTYHKDFIRERIFKSVVNLLNNLENCQLIVKLHPIEEISYYQKLSEKYNAKNIQILKDVDLHDVIIASDIVIGSSTGAQIEALLLDKVVIDLNYETASDVYLMKKFGAVIPVHDPKKLELAVQNALYDKELSDSLKKGRQKHIEYCFYKFDGKASLRVKNLIEEILEV